MPDADIEFRTWVSKHEVDITKFLRNIKELRRNLRNRVNALQPFIDIDRHKRSGVKITPWIYDPPEEPAYRGLVYDFETPDGLKFSIEATLYMMKWNIEVACRKGTSLASIQKILKHTPISPFKPVAEDWLQFERGFDFDTDKVVIAEKMQEMIDYVVKTTKSRQKKGGKRLASARKVT